MCSIIMLYMYDCFVLLDWELKSSSKPVGVAVIMFCIISLVATAMSMSFAIFVYRVRQSHLNPFFLVYQPNYIKLVLKPSTLQYFIRSI